MKTAMQELITTYNKLGYLQFDNWLANHEKRLLKKEKEQIQNVFEHCWNHPNWKGEYDIKDMNDYINQNK
jgi:hypothetical protein